MRRIASAAHRGLVLLVLLGSLFSASAAAAIPDPRALRPATIPGVSASTGTELDPEDQPSGASGTRSATRTLTDPSGRLIGIEGIFVFDTAERAAAKAATIFRMETSPARGSETYAVWRAVPYPSGLVFDQFVLVEGGVVVTMNLDADLGLSDAEIDAIAGDYRTRIDRPSDDGDGSTIVNAVIIALAGVLVAGATVSGRRQTSRPYPPTV